MISTQERKSLKRGCILQVVSSERDDNRFPAGMLVIVEAFLSWGIVAMVRAPNTDRADLLSLTWNVLELTGGSALLTADGERLREPEVKPTHHP